MVKEKEEKHFFVEDDTITQNELNKCTRCGKKFKKDEFKFCFDCGKKNEM